MDKDYEIYQSISKWLIEALPVEAKKVSMHAELISENDVCDFKFIYLDKNNEMQPHILNGIACSNLHDLLVELRQFFLSQNKPYWKGCEFQENLETGKFEVNFIYE